MLIIDFAIDGLLTSYSQKYIFSCCVCVAGRSRSKNMPTISLGISWTRLFVATYTKISAKYWYQHIGTKFDLLWTRSVLKNDLSNVFFHAPLTLLQHFNTGGNESHFNS